MIISLDVNAWESSVHINVNNFKYIICNMTYNMYIIKINCTPFGLPLYSVVDAPESGNATAIDLTQGVGGILKEVSHLVTVLFHWIR